MNEHSASPTLEQSQQQLEYPPVKEEKPGYHIKKGALIAAAIFAIVGICLYFVFNTQIGGGIDRNKYSAQTRAKYTGIPQCASGEGGTCTITYEYEVDGKTYTKTFYNLDGYDLLNSNDAKIYYNPNDPNDASLAPNTLNPDNAIKNYYGGQFKSIGIALIGFGVLLLIDAFVGYYIDTFHKNINKKLQEAADKSVESKKGQNGTA